LFEKVPELSQEDEVAQPQRLKEIEDGLTKLEQRPSSVHHRAEFDTLWTRLEELKTDTVQLGKFKDMVLKQNSKDVEALHLKICRAKLSSRNC